MEDRWIQNLLNKIKNTGIPKNYQGYPIENIENALKSNSSGCSVEPMVICQFYNAKIPDLICATEVVIKINDDRLRNLVKKYLNDDITISDLQNKVKDIALDTLTISDIEIDI